MDTERRTTPVELRTGGETILIEKRNPAKFTINGVGSSGNPMFVITEPMQPIHIVFVPPEGSVPPLQIPFSASTTAVQISGILARTKMLSNYPGYIIVGSEKIPGNVGFMRAYRPTQNERFVSVNGTAPLLESAPADYTSNGGEWKYELAPNGKLPAPFYKGLQKRGNVDNPVTEYITMSAASEGYPQSSGHEEMSISTVEFANFGDNRFHYLRSLFESYIERSPDSGEGVTINHGLMDPSTTEVDLDAIDYFKGGALSIGVTGIETSKIGGQASATIREIEYDLPFRWLIRYRYIVDTQILRISSIPDCLDYLPVSIASEFAAIGSSVTNTLVDAPRVIKSVDVQSCGFIAAPYDKPTGRIATTQSADGKGKTRVLRWSNSHTSLNYPEVPKTSDVEVSLNFMAPSSNPKENGMATFEGSVVIDTDILLAAVVSTENASPYCWFTPLVRLDRGLFDYKFVSATSLRPLPKQWLYAYPTNPSVSGDNSNTDWSLTDNPKMLPLNKVDDFGMASELKRHFETRLAHGVIDVPDAGLVAGTTYEFETTFRAEPIVDTEGINLERGYIGHTPNGLRHYLYVNMITDALYSFAVGASDKNTKVARLQEFVKAECNDSAKAAAIRFTIYDGDAGYLEATVKEGWKQHCLAFRGGGAVSVYLDGEIIGAGITENLLAKTWVRCDSGKLRIWVRTDYGAQIGLTTTGMGDLSVVAVINTGAGIDFSGFEVAVPETTPMFQWFSPDNRMERTWQNFYLLNGARKEGTVSGSIDLQGKTWTVGSTRTTLAVTDLNYVAAALANAKEDSVTDFAAVRSDNRGVTPNVLNDLSKRLDVPTASQTVPGIARYSTNLNGLEAVTGLSDKGHHHNFADLQIGLDLADNTADVDKPLSDALATLLNNQPMDTGSRTLTKKDLVTPASLLPYEGDLSSYVRKTSEPGVVTLTDKPSDVVKGQAGKGSKADPVTGKVTAKPATTTVDPDDNKLYISGVNGITFTTLLTTTALMGYQQDPGTGGGLRIESTGSALGMDKLTLNGTGYADTTGTTRFMEWKAGINTIVFSAEAFTLKSNGSVVLACFNATISGTRALFRSPAGESEQQSDIDKYISKWVSKESKGVFLAYGKTLRQLTSEVRALGLHGTTAAQAGAHPVNLKTPDTGLGTEIATFNYPGHIASTNPAGAANEQIREKLTELKDAVLWSDMLNKKYVASAVHDVELDDWLLLGNRPSLYPATPAAVASGLIEMLDELIKALNNPTAANPKLRGAVVFEGQMLGGTFYALTPLDDSVTTPVFCGVHLIVRLAGSSIPLTRGTDYELEYDNPNDRVVMLDHRPFFEGLVYDPRGVNPECHFIEERIIDSTSGRTLIIRD
ncbi:hypothetical protein SPFM14_00099 [Salmonella phage SPFM14]|nr:hypothetical protein SPFM14_00099 [Salmonella phage SPFM14]